MFAVLNVVQNTRKIQHLSCVIKNGNCSCGEKHVGETIRDCKIRWDEHNDVHKNSESAKHLARRTEHELIWYVFTRAPKNTSKEEFWKHIFIKSIVPSFNKQLDNDVLMLFRNAMMCNMMIHI